jgi:hypothetical protein
VGGDPGTGEMSSISTLSVITGVPWFGIEMDKKAFDYGREKFSMLVRGCVPSAQEPHYLQGHVVRRLRIFGKECNFMDVLWSVTLLYAYDGKGVGANFFISNLEGNHGTNPQLQYTKKYQYLRRMFLNPDLEIACISSLTPRLWGFFQLRDDWYESQGSGNRRAYKNTFMCPLGRLWCVTVLHGQGFGTSTTMLHVWWRPAAVLRTYAPNDAPHIVLADSVLAAHYQTLQQSEGGCAIFDGLSTASGVHNAYDPLNPSLIGRPSCVQEASRQHRNQIQQQQQQWHKQTIQKQQHRQ